MKLIITIDTEEDNWDRYSTKENPVENIRQVPLLQTLFDRYGYKPTYMITYPVATHPQSIAVLKKIMDGGRCEIGMHCHPWNTPPFEGEVNSYRSMLCNLPQNLVEAKLETLHRAIEKNFNSTPVSFRAGRWGFGPGVARAIHKLGYKVDTSVTPFINWADEHGPDFTRFDPEPYRFSPASIGNKDKQGALLEVPATVGFLQKNFQLCRLVMMITEKQLPRRLHMGGLLQRSRILNRVWLSPEMTDIRQMIKIARSMEKNGYSCLNMTFHSTSLLAGYSPFILNKVEEGEFFQKIEKFLAYAQNAGWKPGTLVEL